MMMMVCFNPADDNTAMIEELKRMGNWSNRIEGAWILETTVSPRQVRDLLTAKMQPGQRLFVARISQAWAGRAMGEGFPEWMQRRDFGRFTS